MTISSIEELSEFIALNDLNLNEVSEIIESTLKVHIGKDCSQSKLILTIKDFYNGYPNIKKKLLDLDLQHRTKC